MVVQVRFLIITLSEFESGGYNSKFIEGLCNFSQKNQFFSAISVESVKFVKFTAGFEEPL